MHRPTALDRKMVLKWRRKYWCPHIVMMHQQLWLLEVECPRVLPGGHVLQVGRRTIPSAFNASGRMVRGLSSNRYVFPGITTMGAGESSLRAILENELARRGIEMHSTGDGRKARIEAGSRYRGRRL